MGGSDDRETPLTGGNMTPVVRVGSTVRRRAGPWTPTIQAFLGHIRRNGFDHAPEPLGTDRQGREIVSFLDGETGQYPLADWAWADSVLTEVAGLQRRFHDSTVGFKTPPDAVWQLASHEPAEIICHNDFAPYNIVFRDRRPVGVIDFDTASPGPRLWDLAYTAYRFVPLTAAENPDTPACHPDEQRRRLALFCAAYGLAGQTSSVLPMVVRRLDVLMDFITSRAAVGDMAQQRVLERGDVKIYAADRTYIVERLL